MRIIYCIVAFNIFCGSYFEMMAQGISGKKQITSTTQVAVAKIFADNIVLQRNIPVPIWGTAKTNENFKFSFQ